VIQTRYHTSLIHQSVYYGLTGLICTCGSERELTLKGSWYADEEIHAGADRSNLSGRIAPDALKRIRAGHSSLDSDASSVTTKAAFLSSAIFGIPHAMHLRLLGKPIKMRYSSFLRRPARHSWQLGGVQSRRLGLIAVRPIRSLVIFPFFGCLPASSF
jgi:hypothetical protein